jgi:hypothetical protein
VSLIVGALALLTALGRGGGEATGSKGALETLLAQPLGSVLLATAALGLFGFAAWCVCQALLDADRRGASAQALAVRAGQAVAALLYAGLGVFAVGLLLGWPFAGGGGGEEQSARDWTAWLLARPFGRWLVGGVGLAVVGAGLGMAHVAWSASFMRRLGCNAATARWVIPLGRVGHAARAMVFVTIGVFVLVAAWQADPGEARGLGGALLALRAQPFGRALFALVALGLAAFGFVEARYRRIAAPDGAAVAKTLRTRAT